MSIKRHMAVGSGWSIAAAVFNNLSMLAVFVVLARILTPAQFGIVAFASLFVDVSRIVVISGIPDALVQREDWDDELASSAFWVNLGVGTLVCALLSLVAGPAAGNAYDATFGLVLAALSAILLVDGSTAIHTAELRRNFQYKSIAMRGMFGRILSGAIGISLAFSGWGIWSLVISRLIASAATSVVLWRASTFRPKFVFSASKIREILPFSLHQLGSGLLGQINMQLAAFVIGVVGGPAAIAQYRVGSRALDLMINLIINPLRSTALSALSRVRSRPDGVALGYFRLTRTCALVACPLFFGSAVVAPDFIPFVFGPQWVQGGYVMMALSVVVGPAVLTYFHSATLAASNHSKVTFRITLGQVTGTLIVALILSPLGAIAVAIGQTARAHVTLPISLFLVKRVTGIPMWRSVVNIAPAYLTALIVAAVLLAGRYYLLLDLPLLGRMALLGGLVPLLYLAGLRLLFPSFLRENLEELTPLLPKPLQSLVFRIVNMTAART